MSLEFIILLLIASGLVAYLLSKISKGLGALITILAPIYAMVMLFIEGEDISIGFYVPFLDLNVTPLGMFFSLIMLFIYSMVAFFNPFWMKKISHAASYNMFYLISLAGTIGLFFATDFIQLFLFFELVVWTSMFIIPLGKSRIASIVYYSVSALGTFALLFAVLLMAKEFGTFEIQATLFQLKNNPTLSTYVYILFGIAALAKIGAFPLHIWLPLAHGSAPDTFSPVLSGGLVKMGAFVAILLVFGMNTSEAFKDSFHVLNTPIQNYILMILGGITIVIGTLMAIAQDDAKKLLAYSSVSNGGYILIGIAIADHIGLAGALFHIFAHALATAGAFMAIAAVSYRTKTTKISELGGMIHHMPITFVVYLVSIISMAGIPPMGGFVSKWLIFQSLTTNGFFLVAGAAFFGSIGSFLYVFKPLAAVFLGQKLPRYNHVKEVNIIMLFPMIILALVSTISGIVPSLAWKYIDPILAQYKLKEMNPSLWVINGYNGDLNTGIIASIFALGVFVAFIMFILLPKSRKVGLMDTYTAGEFIYTPDLLHYASDFYAPFTRMYEKHPSILKFYKNLVNKIKEFGQFVKYLFFSYKTEVTVFWMIVVITIVMWGGKLW